MFAARKTAAEETPEAEEAPADVIDLEAKETISYDVFDVSSRWERFWNVKRCQSPRSFCVPRCVWDPR